MDVDGMIDRTVAKEGSYSNHPADRGGPTNWGITEQTARAHGYAGDMKHMPREDALRIYRQIYWLRPEFDRVASIYPKVAEELFDTGVNMGPGTASKFLQRALNALNRGAADYGDIVADGDIGPGTIYALKEYARKRGIAGENVLLKALEILQGSRYFDIVEKSPSQEVFLYGWIANRIGFE